jgi:hypothetical protein
MESFSFSVGLGIFRITSGKEWSRSIEPMYRGVGGVRAGLLVWGLGRLLVKVPQLSLFYIWSIRGIMRILSGVTLGADHTGAASLNLSST